MHMRGTLLVIAAVGLIAPTHAAAAVCDFRLSRILSAERATALLASGASGATIGSAAVTLGGLYFFPDTPPQTLLLGSTLAGATASGTMGLVGGSGFATSVLSVLSAPVTIAGAAGAALIVGGMEAGCYLADERITDPDAVLAILSTVAATANEDLFKLYVVPDDVAAETGDRSRVRIPDADGTFRFYDVADLYISAGKLMHRDRFRDTNLGNIAVAVVAQD